MLLQVACYRGPELYDSPHIQNIWTKWAAHYKHYRPILMADPVHVKRPTGNDYELTLSVRAPNQGAAAAAGPAAFGNLFNPTSRSIAIKTLTLPLYYAGVGVGSEVYLSWGGSLIDPSKWAVPGNSTATVLADHTVRLTGVTMAPKSFLWCVVSE